MLEPTAAGRDVEEEEEEEEEKERRGEAGGVISPFGVQQQVQFKVSSLPSHSRSDIIRDLPSEALGATTLPQFTQHMRPYLWVQFPSATSAEINAAIQV